MKNNYLNFLVSFRNISITNPFKFGNSDDDTSHVVDTKMYPSIKSMQNRKIFKWNTLAGIP